MAVYSPDGISNGYYGGGGGSDGISTGSTSMPGAPSWMDNYNQQVAGANYYRTQSSPSGQYSPYGDPNVNAKYNQMMSAANMYRSSMMQQDKNKSLAGPTMGTFSYSDNATNYPTYMRNLGENMAQQKFQTGVNQGVRLGNSVQGYMGAMNNRNNDRLGYMAQAGQQDLFAQGKIADEVAKRNAEQLQLYGLQTQRMYPQGQHPGPALSVGGRQMPTGGGGYRDINGNPGESSPYSSFGSSNNWSGGNDGSGSGGISSDPIFQGIMSNINQHTG